MAPDMTRHISLAVGVCGFSQAIPLTMDVRCEHWSHFTDGQVGAEVASG